MHTTNDMIDLVNYHLIVSASSPAGLEALAEHIQYALDMIADYGFAAARGFTQDEGLSDEFLAFLSHRQVTR